MITMCHRAALAWRSPPGLSRSRIDLARGCLDRSDTAQPGPGRLGAQPVRVIAGGDQQGGGAVDADPVERQQVLVAFSEQLGE